MLKWTGKKYISCADLGGGTAPPWKIQIYKIHIVKILNTHIQDLLSIQFLGHDLLLLVEVESAEEEALEPPFPQIVSRWLRSRLTDLGHDFLLLEEVESAEGGSFRTPIN